MTTGVVDTHAPTPSDASGMEVIVAEPGPAERDPRRWTTRRRRLGLILAWLPPIVALITWEVAAKVNIIDVRLFPAPSDTVDQAWVLITNGDVLHHVVATTRRLLFGFALGLIPGLIAGLALGRFALLRATFSPTIAGLYTIPKIGIFPLLLLIFGIGESPKIIIVAYATFLVMVIGSVDAMANVPKNFLDVGRTVNASRRRVLFEIILPAAAPQIFTAARVAIGMSVLVEIATEFIASNDGIGWLIWNSWSLFQPSNMFVGIGLSAVLGVVATAIINGLEALMTPSAGRSSRSRKRKGKKQKAL